MRSYHKFSSKLFMLTFRNICTIHELAFNNILNLVTLIPNTDIRPIRHRNIDIPKINYITLSINLRQFRISNPFELIRAHIGFSFHCKYPPPPFKGYQYPLSLSYIYRTHCATNKISTREGALTGPELLPVLVYFLIFQTCSICFLHILTVQKTINRLIKSGVLF